MSTTTVRSETAAWVGGAGGGGEEQGAAAVSTTGLAQSAAATGQTSSQLLHAWVHAQKLAHAHALNHGGRIACSVVACCVGHTHTHILGEKLVEGLKCSGAG